MDDWIEGEAIDRPMSDGELIELYVAIHRERAASPAVVAARLAVITREAQRRGLVLPGSEVL